MYRGRVVIRPPSEANSFLLSVTIGCSHNKCTFCGTYMGVKFGIRDVDDIRTDIDKVAQNYSWSVRRVFLENGDALICPQHRLLEELKLIIQSSNFTNCFFTANHASNYLPIKVRLPEQKTGILRLIDDVLVKGDMSQLRPEFARAL